MFQRLCRSLVVVLLAVGFCGTQILAQDDYAVMPVGAYVPFTRTFTVPQRSDTTITVSGSYERINNVATNISITSYYASSTWVTIEGVYPFQNGYNITIDVYYRYLGVQYVYTINT